MVYSFVAFVVWGYAKPKKAERDLRAELGVLIRIGKLPLFLEEGKEKTQAYLKAAIDDVHLGLDIVEEIERRNPPGQAARLQTMKEVIAKKRGGPAEGRG